MTLTSENFRRKIKEWKIEHENPLTYHGHIYFKIGDGKTPNNALRRKTRLDKNKFTAAILKLQNEQKGNYYEIVKQAHKIAIEGENGEVDRKHPIGGMMVSGSRGKNQ